MLDFARVMDMQRELQEKHRGEWEALAPEYGRSCLLWVVEELGEVASVLKKRGESAVMTDPAVRGAFLEEFVDVSMFLIDALMCYGFTAEDFSRAYEKKHAKNMSRDFAKRNAEYLAGVEGEEA